MPNLHDFIMATAKRNNASGNTDPNTKPKNVTTRDGSKHITTRDDAKFRISSGMTLAVSTALHDQLQRYCTANPRAHKTTGELKPMSTAKAIRYAVYEALNDPSKLKPRPKLLPSFVLAPTRDQHLSWTFDKKQDREPFDTLCKSLGLTASAFTRRAIYLFTKDHADPDAKTHMQAASDGWET